MRRLQLIPLALAFSAILFSCQKEGPAGAIGPAGPAGPPGPTGPTGSANVIYSPWFTPATNGGWVDSSINGVAAQKKFNKSAPGVTLNMLNTGVILGYMKLNPDGAGGTTTSVRPLPYVNPGTATAFFMLPYVGSITFAQVSTANPGVAVSASSSSLEFRYVIVPGGTAGGRMMNAPASGYSSSELRTMSYEQIAKLFNIPANGSNE